MNKRITNRKTVNRRNINSMEESMSTPAAELERKPEKLTLYIDGKLIKELKHHAIDADRSVSEIAEALFKDFLAEPNPPQSAHMRRAASSRTYRIR